LVSVTGRGVLRGVPAYDHEEEMMDEETRRDREVEALELIAAELEKLRMLKEREIGRQVVDEEGSLYVRPVEEG
jgi:hypothetical protein